MRETTHLLAVAEGCTPKLRWCLLAVLRESEFEGSHGNACIVDSLVGLWRSHNGFCVAQPILRERNCRHCAVWRAGRPGRSERTALSLRGGGRPVMGLAEDLGAQKNGRRYASPLALEKAKLQLLQSAQTSEWESTSLRIWEKLECPKCLNSGRGFY